MLPVRLARLHRSLEPGARLDLRLSRPAATSAGEAIEVARKRLSGAGFEGVRVTPGRDRTLHVRARRAFTLPDWVTEGLEVLICGLNPSIYAARTGIPFGRPGNRFWPAARGAGLVERDRDLADALRHGVGFTDLSKRPTTRASELTPREYARGLARLSDTLHTFRPRVVCFVGLDGWRRAIDRRARPGWIRGGFEGRRAYLMPSTSGLNAHARLSDLVRHLRRVRR